MSQFMNEAVDELVALLVVGGKKTGIMDINVQKGEDL